MKQYESPNFRYVNFLGTNALSDSSGLINYGDNDWGKKDEFND